MEHDTLDQIIAKALHEVDLRGHISQPHFENATEAVRDALLAEGETWWRNPTTDRDYLYSIDSDGFQRVLVIPLLVGVGVRQREERHTMSGERIEPARCVWFSRGDHFVLQFLSGYLTAGTTEHEWVLSMLARRDAAPADPVEAVNAAIASEWMNTGMGNEERIDEVYSREGAAIYRTQAVLRALGWEAS